MGRVNADREEERKEERKVVSEPSMKIWENIT